MVNINTLDMPAEKTRDDSSPSSAGQDEHLLLEDQSPTKAESTISMQQETSQPEQHSGPITEPDVQSDSPVLLLPENQPETKASDEDSDIKDLDKEMSRGQESGYELHEGNKEDFSENSPAVTDSESKQAEEHDQPKGNVEISNTSSTLDPSTTLEDSLAISASAKTTSTDEKKESEEELAQQPVLLLEASSNPEEEKQASANALLPSVESASNTIQTVSPTDSIGETPITISSMKETAPSATTPFGSDTVLVEGKSILLRTYEDSEGKWYEAYPILRSLSWMSKSQQEKFIRRWIPKQCTQLISQPSAQGYYSKTTHLNKEGLQELLAQIERVKPSYLETSTPASETLSSNPNKDQIEEEKSLQPSTYPPPMNQTEQSTSPQSTAKAQEPSTIFAPTAELLVSDEIIRTPIYTDDSGTWFGTLPLIYNTKYEKGGYAGKFLRRLVGSSNVRNIEQETPTGKRGRLYTNEEGLRKLVKKLGKSLELIALPGKESRVIDPKPEAITTGQSSDTTLPASTGYRTVTVSIGKVKATLRLYTDGNETWVCATDIIKALHYKPTKGTARVIGEFVSTSDMKDISQPTANGSRPLVHVNMQAACKLIEGISAKKGLSFSQENFLEAIARTANVHPTTSSAVVQSNTGMAVSKSSTASDKAYGVRQITLAGVAIPTRTYTDTSGTWYNVSDLVLDTRLKTPKTKVLMLKKLNKKDVRLILQPSPTGLRLMSHVNEEGLSSILPELEETDTVLFGKQNPINNNTVGESHASSLGTSSQTSMASQPVADHETYGMVTIQVEGKPIQAKTYRDASGVWIAARELLKASKYANRHDGTKLLGILVGNENIRKIVQKTIFGKREITHISEKGLEMLLKDINGKLVEGNGILGTTPVLSDSMDSEALFEIPKMGTTGDMANGESASRQKPSLEANRTSPYGLAVLNYKGANVEIPTFVDDSGLWFCVYDLLQIAGRTTSSTRSSTMKKAIKNGEIRLINRKTPNGSNNFSHVNEVGLNELLSELYGFQVTPEIKIVREGTPEKEKSHDDFLFSMEQLVGNKPRPTLAQAKKHSVFDEQRLGEKAPRPGDNSGVFTSLSVLIDQRKLLVKTYTDNHKTWYATPDMFELVEISDKEKQREFLADTLDKSDIKFIWQHYKDGLKLQPHVQSSALNTLVQALTKVAEQARQRALSSTADHKVEAIPMPNTAAMERERKVEQIPQETSKAGLQPASFASPTQNDSRYAQERMQTVGNASSPINAGQLSSAKYPSGVQMANAGQGNSTEKDIVMSLGGSILGSTTIDLFGKPVAVKTTTVNNELWYNAVDIIVGFNAIEEAEGKPTLKKADLSHYVKAVVDKKNVEKLNQKISTQNAVRLMTHINAEGLEQLKLALLITRAGGKPTSPVPVQTVQAQPIPKVPQAPEPPAPQATAISQPMGSNPTASPTNFPNPQPSFQNVPPAARANVPLTYGRENVYLLGSVVDMRTVSDADGKWYAVDDLLDPIGIQRGSPERNFIESNVRTGIFRWFWQSGPLGIQKISHVSFNGLYEMLNAIEVLAQQRRPIG